MPIDETHSIMNAPKTNINLWRYMDIPTFLSILTDEALTFVRADLFEDKYEGKLPILTANLIDHQERQRKADQQQKTNSKNLSEFLNSMNKDIYLNCWCNENHEMVHMWKIYSKENGLAIETDYEKLKSAILTDEQIYPTEIRYVDFKNELVDWQANGLTVYTLKRMEYKSEKEFRLILAFPRIVEDQLIDIKPDENSIQLRNALYLRTPVVKCKINPAILIKRIHVSPYAPKWYLSLITELVKRFEINVESISQSDL